MSEFVIDPRHQSDTRKRRRQFGAERRTLPLPSVHPRPSDRAVILGRLAIVATVLFWGAYVVTTIVRQFLNGGTTGFRFTMETVSYVIVVTFLTFSALMYLVARLGAMERFRAHTRTPRAELDRHFADAHGSMTVLVPSYAEEPDVIRATLWSAALQEYPSLRVVLLLDDPPTPTDGPTMQRLRRTRSIARQLEADLAEPAARFSAALHRAETATTGDVDPQILGELIDHYDWAAGWLSDRAAAEPLADHVDVFFAGEVLLALAADLTVTAEALASALEQNEPPTPDRILGLFRRLAWTFQAEVVTFERKTFASLSHEPNKAMNLNSYLGLMGGSYRTESTPGGPVLRRTEDETADLTIPATDYVLTLDADSLLLRDYCLRLAYFLEQPGNERVAVAQTPYSAFRGASTRIERLAGATTDLQHILHQGKSRYNAAFWVGANAVIRTSALADIAEVEVAGGFPITRFVRDRTVIEDTESSIDLGAHGWQLVNYPERLSYSATPPDFGSLIVQRRRWANGGLLILATFWRQLRDRRRRGEEVGLTEILLRVNYMASIAWASFGLLFLLAYPYDSRLLSPFVLLAALPYFLAMASDLKTCGYRYRDVLWIYGFNLILLPVNLAGVLKSIQQAITGKKIPFARTPKVRNRTAAPLLYVLAPYAIVAFSALTFWRDYHAGNWGNATFAAFNAILAMAAILAYVGLWNSVVDIWLGATDWLYVPQHPPARRPPASVDPTELDWRGVLYHGDAGAHVVAPRRQALAQRSRERISS